MFQFALPCEVKPTAGASFGAGAGYTYTGALRVYVNWALYRLRYFLQIGRFVRVEAAGFGELCGGDVPREDAGEAL